MILKIEALLHDASFLCVRCIMAPRGKRGKHTVWGKGLAIEKLKQAVYKYDNDGPLALGPNEKKLSKCAIARRVQIPLSTFRKYAN